MSPKNELPCGEDGATISAQNRLSDRAQTPSLKLFYATSLSALAKKGLVASSSPSTSSVILRKSHKFTGHTT
jgi:hypothetical protein